MLSVKNATLNKASLLSLSLLTVNFDGQSSVFSSPVIATIVKHCIVVVLNISFKHTP